MLGRKWHPLSARHVSPENYFFFVSEANRIMLEQLAPQSIIRLSHLRFSSGSMDRLDNLLSTDETPFQ